MQHNFLRLITLVLILVPQLGLASVEKLTTLFKENFNVLYEQNYCGKNIQAFVELAYARGIDLAPGHVVLITNKGQTEIDPIVGFQAREAGGFIPEAEKEYVQWTHYGVRYKKPVPPDVRLRFPGVTKWSSHHAIFEYQDVIFDFDFTNEPRVVPTKSYVRAMFFPRSENDYLRNRSLLGFFSGENYRDFIRLVKENYLFELIPTTGRSGKILAVDDARICTFVQYVRGEDCSRKLK